MICPNCGTWLNVERPTCPSCGAPIKVLSQAGVDQSDTVRNILQQEENKKRTYRLIGFVFLIIGIVSLIIGFFTYYAMGEWVLCSTSFIWLGAGLITIFTNLTKKYTNI